MKHWAPLGLSLLFVGCQPEQPLVNFDEMTLGMSHFSGAYSANVSFVVNDSNQYYCAPPNASVFFGDVTLSSGSVASGGCVDPNFFGTLPVGFFAPMKAGLPIRLRAVDPGGAVEIQLEDIVRELGGIELRGGDGTPLPQDDDGAWVVDRSRSVTMVWDSGPETLGNDSAWSVTLQGPGGPEFVESSPSGGNLSLSLDFDGPRGNGFFQVALQQTPSWASGGLVDVACEGGPVCRIPQPWWDGVVPVSIAGGSNTVCNNNCSTSFDGVCDDGEEGATNGNCLLGTDCNDCGPREL